MKVKQLLEILAIVSPDAEVRGGGLPTSIEVLEGVTINSDNKTINLKFKYELKEKPNEN